MSPTADLWVVVPFYNEERGIAATLAALLAQSDPAFALLLVDNASTDGTIRVIEDFFARHPERPYRMIVEPRKGTGAASDSGFRCAIARGARWIARTDADCLPERHWVARIKEGFAREGLEFIAGKIRPRDDQEPLTALDRALLPAVVLIAERIGRLRRRGPQFRYPYFMAAGNNLAITADLYLRTGGFPRVAIEDEHEDRVLSERVRTLTHRARLKRDVVVYNSVRRLKCYGYVNTILWYWGHHHRPPEVDVR